MDIDGVLLVAPVCDFWGISTKYAQLSHGNTPIITRYHSVRCNQLSAVQQNHFYYSLASCNCVMRVRYTR